MTTRWSSVTIEQLGVEGLLHCRSEWGFYRWELQCGARGMGSLRECAVQRVRQRASEFGRGQTIDVHLERQRQRLDRGEASVVLPVAAHQIELQ